MPAQEANPPKTPIETVAEEMFGYAIDRQSVKWLMANLPPEADVNRPTVEYELQALKIVTVGWSISYHLQDQPVKAPLLELFWRSVYEFSNGVTETAKLMTGHDPAYFQTLHKRLDQYVAAMAETPEGSEPVTVIGPVFALICGNENDIFTSMAGAKMFSTVVVDIQRYLQAEPWQPEHTGSIH